MVKLVDALDSKSSGPCAHGGSIPPPGTKNNKCSGISNAPNNFTTRILMVFAVKSLFLSGILQAPIFDISILVNICEISPHPAIRRPNRYCVYDLAKAISRMTEIPFVPAFTQKTDKVHHGRHASLSQSEPRLLESWNIRNRSILFVDDRVTSGTTARLCYEVLVAMGNQTMWMD